MKLNTKILAGIATSAILATGAVAYMNDGQHHNDAYHNGGKSGKGYHRGNGYCNGEGRHMGQGKGWHMGGQYGMGHRNGFINLVQQLNLTDKQKKELDGILNQNEASAFSENGFDKKAYIKQRETTREDVIEREANFIEKVYGILDKNQKKELKALIDSNQNRWHKQAK